MRINISGTPDQRWNEWLRELDGNIYHSVNWAETQSTGTHHPLYFHWLDTSNRILALAIAIESHSSFPIFGRLSKHLEFGCYPANNNQQGSTNQDLIPQILQYAREKGYNTALIQSYYAAERDVEFQSAGFEKSNRLEFLIDLTLSDEQLVKNLSTNHRRKLSKASKEDLKHEVGRDIEAMRLLRRLQVRSRDRRIDRGEDIATAADAYFERFGRDYFERNLGEVHYLTKEGTPVSAAFISIYNNKGYYVFGGSNDTGFAMNAPGLLFMKIFAHCRELGCREFNMGGVPALAADKSAQSHGLYRFKAGFGGKSIPCVSLKADNLQPGRGWLFKIARKVLPGR